MIKIKLHFITKYMQCHKGCKKFAGENSSLLKLTPITVISPDLVVIFSLLCFCCNSLEYLKAVFFSDSE